MPPDKFTRSREDIHHLIAQSLALDHIDCHPDECEFVGVTYTSDWSEFDATADKIVDMLDAHGWLRTSPRMKETNLYPP